MIGFSHRIRGMAVGLSALALSFGSIGCDSAVDDAGLVIGLSPQAGVIAPCSPTIADAWSFAVSAGDEVMITVDTTDTSTAADFELRGICGPTDFIFADDNFLCTFPPPAFSCPATTLTASVDATCTIDVTPALTGANPPSAACADPARAEYELFVDVAGEPALLSQVRHNSDRKCIGGSNNARSCSNDEDCPGGSCELALSLRTELKQIDAMQPIGD